MNRSIRLSAAVLAGSLVASTASARFADRVVEYVPNDATIGDDFNDPTAALGEPTRVTNPTHAWGGVTTPFSASWGPGEVVSIGEGGHLTLELASPATNDPSNLFGIDLLVFGNAFYSGSDLFENPATIFVSEDGVEFHEVAGVFADSAFPTLGYLDVDNPYPGVDDGSIPSDFHKPVDPSLDLAGMSFENILAAYDGSGGGTGVDIGSVGLSEVNFIRFENAVGSGYLSQIDAVTVVPEPAALALVALPLLALRRRR